MSFVMFFLNQGRSELTGQPHSSHFFSRRLSKTFLFDFFVSKILYFVDPRRELQFIHLKELSNIDLNIKTVSAPIIASSNKYILIIIKGNKETKSEKKTILYRVLMERLLIYFLMLI